MNKAAFEKVRIVSVEHLGFEAKYYHPDSDSLDLPGATVDLYENHKDQARIFIQNVTGDAFSSAELLDWFLLQTQTRLDEHLPENAGEGDAMRCFVTFPMRFPEGMFHMATNAGNTDMKSLKLLIQVTLG